MLPGARWLATLLRGWVPYHLLRRGASSGWCPICERRTLFYREGPWLRDQLRCLWCFSIPRWRALVQALETHFPGWRELRIHESSPGGASSAKLARECPRYLPTHYFPDTPPGAIRHGRRCEDLERQTFPDGSFDLVVTQDVFEHVLDPARAFAEVARTLVPGGAHLFTVPWYRGKETRTRAVRENGRIKHLEPPEYHRDPLDPRGSLVATEWGSDLPERIRRASCMATTVLSPRDPHCGIDGEFLEVFISRKTA